jgi:CRISPR-associated protein Cmr2
MNSTMPSAPPNSLSPGRLFFFQLGPVQEFIAQARSTRDLWSGSYMLSWMTGHVIRAIQSHPESHGSVKLVLPQLDANPMMQWINGNAATRTVSIAKDATLPTVPNRFLAIVPDGFTSEQVRNVVKQIFEYRLSEANPRPTSEWEKICAACREWFEHQTPRLFETPDKLDLWHRQLASFWQPTWLLWPASEDAGLNDADQIKLFYQSPVGRHWREKNGQDPDSWMVRYHLALHRLDARRQTRNFDAWQGERGLHKDSLSGKEEAIADKQWLEKIPPGKNGKNNPLTHLFRNPDPLGAPNLVKRVWHKAYLETEMGLNKQSLEGPTARGSFFDIPSVPGVAVFPWACKIWSKRRDPAMQRFWTAVEQLDAYLDLQLPKKMDWAGEEPEKWLARVDWEVFRNGFWEDQLRSAQAAKESDWETLAKIGAAALARFRAEENVGSPSSYYAVLAGDGDGMGKWLSGERPDGHLFSLDEVFHKRLSAAISGFSTKNRNLSHLVEDVRKEGIPFQGKIVYAGGEDVLAILPADQAIACAIALRKAYQEAMRNVLPLPDKTSPVPFTYSVGIAIGHIKEPLQDMIEAARQAEHRAKDKLDRNALAVTLFKRGGEIIEWGCKFSTPRSEPSAALQLLKFVQGEYESGKPRFRSKLDDAPYIPPISGKFPHRLAELLSRYQNTQTPEALSDDLCKIAEREVEWAVSRQCGKLADSEQKELIGLCAAYLDELKTRKAPLCEFHHLFAVEAFMARQGE